MSPVSYLRLLGLQEEIIFFLRRNGLLRSPHHYEITGDYRGCLTTFRDLFNQPLIYNMGERSASIAQSYQISANETFQTYQCVGIVNWIKRYVNNNHYVYKDKDLSYERCCTPNGNLIFYRDSTGFWARRIGQQKNVITYKTSLGEVYNEVIDNHGNLLNTPIGECSYTYYPDGMLKFIDLNGDRILEAS